MCGPLQDPEKSDIPVITSVFVAIAPVCTLTFCLTGLFLCSLALVWVLPKLSLQME